MIDYHVHTPLCRHAEGTMEVYVTEAIRLGFAEICFLDHLTVSEYGRDLSMTPDELPVYFNTARSLKDAFSGRIKVKVGLEIDFHPAYTNLYVNVVQAFPFDVIGSALHFPNGIDVVRFRSEWSRMGDDTNDIYWCYYDELEKMLEYDYFDLICHLDLVKKFGHKPLRPIHDKIANILAIIKKKNLAVEVNTSGLYHPVKEIYPSPWILEQCRQMGIPLTLGSDAHHPDKVGRSFDAAMSFLREIGFTHLTAFTGRQPYLISL